MLTGYAYIPCRPPLPFVKVWIENVGEVTGLVDTGASISAVRCSVVRKFLKADRVNSGLKFCGVDSRRVSIDSFLPLNVKWEGSLVKLDKVAVVRSCPFALILGVDWIINSKTDLIVKDGRIVLKPFCSLDVGVKKKKVRFMGIDELDDLRGKEEEPPFISDEFLESVKEELPKTRSKGKLSASVSKTVKVPGESLLFVKVKIPKVFTGNCMVQGSLCARPGKEWVVPSCIVQVRSGNFKIPVVNLNSSPLKLCRKKIAVSVDLEIDPEFTAVRSESMKADENILCSLVECENDLNCDDFVGKVNLGEHLSVEQKECVLNLLRRRAKCFPTGDCKLGKTNDTVHSIDTGDSIPIRSAPYRVSAFERQVISKKVEEMLDDGIIRPSFSPWASPVVLVKKKSGEFRFCVDYRRLNAITKRDVYPLPLMDDVFDRLAGAKWFSSLDLKSGYWQMLVDPADVSKTAFVTPDGLFEFLRLPFGLNNAPSTFQRLMDRVLANLKWQMCLVYLDDILIFGRSFEEHQQRLDLVLSALEKAGLTLNVSKCIFATTKVFHLGHIIDEHGIQPNPEKISALVNFHISDVKSLRGFLGLASFYRRFVPEFAALAHPLHSLLKKNATWSWTPEKESAKNEIIKVLVSSPVLAHFDNNLEVFVQTDASSVGLGAVLMQDGGEGLKPVVFISRRLTDTETRYHVNELECLAVVWALKKLRCYVYGRHFSVHTDSSAVRWLCNKKEVTGKFARWVLSLQEYDFEIHHIKGVQNLVADALSRNPVTLQSENGGSEIGHVVCVLEYRKPTGMNSSELAFQQQLDSQLRPILTSLSSSSKDNLEKEFIIHNKVLYKINPSSGRKFLLCVPSILRRKIIEFCHDDPSSGHMGLEKSLARVSERYWWPKLISSVRKYVESCNYCQFHKSAVGLPVGQLQPIPPPDRPFHTIGIDHLGPFKVTANGNCHVIVAIDYLSKWVEMAPVADTTSKLAINFIRDNIIYRHGSPVRIISDQGTSFTAHEMEKAMENWNVHHVYATPEHPQTNGLVERTNRTLTLAVAAYVNVNHSNWDIHLPGAMFAINSARQSTTEISPFQLVYGRLPYTCLENQFPWPEDCPESFEVFTTRVNEMREAARLLILKKQEKTKRRVDLRRRVTIDLYPGQLVLVRRNLKKKGFTKKFLPKFTGPFQVVRKICPTTYLVEDLPAHRKRKTYRRFNAHVSQIRKFHSREDVEWDDWPDVAENENSTTNANLPENLPDIQEEVTESTVPPVDVSTSPSIEPSAVTTRRGRRSVQPAWHRDFDMS